MDKLRIGVIGPGNIFRRVMTDRDMLENCVFTAVASSDIDRARAAAAEFGIANAFGSYEEMAKSDKVDIIYISTPHNFHARQAMMCMENKKHVIVEKPAALNGAELSAMTECARRNNVFFMEAMWTWLMPAVIDLKRRSGAGEFGRLMNISADFSYRSEVDPERRLFSMKLAGGSLLDVGVYTLGIAQYLAGGKAVSTQTICRKAVTGADAAMMMLAEYPCGAAAQLMCGIDVTLPDDLDLYYTDAHVHVSSFWHAESYTVYRDGGCETFDFGREHEGHHHEFDHAAECIMNGLIESPVISHSQSMDLIRTAEEIRIRHGIIYPEEM